MPQLNPAPTTILLVRHGETDWNAEGRRQGQAGPGLNDAGRAQAQQAADLLRAEYLPIDALYSSDLDRARETAEVIGAALGLLPVALDARLRERHQGAWQGRLTAEVLPADADPHKVYASPFDEGPPGGETGWQVVERMSAALDAIAARHPGGRVAAVSHGGAMALIGWIAEDRTAAEAADQPEGAARLENGAILAIRWPPVGG